MNPDDFDKDGDLALVAIGLGFLLCMIVFAIATLPARIWRWVRK